MTFINGSHHITLSVGPAQEDVDFHVGTLGLRLVKRTVLFDGVIPVYHLYYSNAGGDPGAVVTTFPFRYAGPPGKRGTNQAREVLLSVPENSLNYWQRRLATRDVESQQLDVLDTRRLLFHHPCGIDYALIEVNDDPRIGYEGGGVDGEFAIHGMYGVGMHVHTPDRMVDFAEAHVHGKHVGEEGDRFAIQVGDPHKGGAIELMVNRFEDQGTWTYSEGTIHHFALNAETLENQDEIKLGLEGAGYVDVSELKDRKYFKSVYVRSPGGALFELAVTHSDGGWTCDESPQELGTRFQLPPQFEDRRAELLAGLEPIDVPAAG